MALAFHRPDNNKQIPLKQLKIAFQKESVLHDKKERVMAK
jgi:hypothetical protein